MNAVPRNAFAIVAACAAAMVFFNTTAAVADAPRGDCEPTWHPFTSGGEIGVNWARDLTVWNGDLIAGGHFTTAGGQTVNRIARWDGSAWHPFTAGGEIGVNGVVRVLTVWNGDLIAGGIFTTAGDQTVNRIARWDGSAWHPFTAGGEIGVNGVVSALTEWNGDLIAGGSFTTAGGQTVNGIARWDGSAWHPFTSGGQIGVSGDSAWVRALTVWNGDLIAGGVFTTAGGQTVNGIARWDGEAWHPLTSDGEIGVSGSVQTLTVWNSDLIAGGFFHTAGGQTVSHIGRWDGSTWHPFTSDGQTGVDSELYAVTAWDDDLIAGGDYGTAGGQTVNSIARWDGCLVGTGACCINGVALGVPVSQSHCLAVGGIYQGDFTDPNAVTCPAICVADLNVDGVVDGADLLMLLSAWGMCP